MFGTPSASGQKPLSVVKAGVRSFTSSPWGLIFVLFFLRSLLGALFPVFGDEAYYLYWGQHFSGGYYDLSPMIGWWIAGANALGLNDIGALRGLNDFSWLCVIVVLERLLMARQVPAERRAPVMILIAAIPLLSLGVLLSPDVPLLLFSTLAIASLLRTLYSGGHPVWIGFFLGLSFLSKYLVVAWAGTFVVYAWKRWLSFRQVVWILLGALPALVQHLWWNWTHCQATITFNFFTRQMVSDGTFVQTFGLFLIYVVLWVTPSGFRLLWGGRLENSSTKNVGMPDFVHALFWIWFPAVVFFAISAMSKGQGLHWYAFIAPWFFLWLGLRSPLDRLRRVTFWMVALSGVLLGSAIGVSQLSGQNPQAIAPLLQPKVRQDFWLSVRTETILAQALLGVPTTERLAVSSESYVLASVFDRGLRQLGRLDTPIFVWGGGSRFGRVFDFTTDIRKLAGRSILVFTRTPLGDVELENFFKMGFERRSVQMHDQTFHFVLGHGFDAEKYFSGVHAPKVTEFYPEILPQGKCELK